MTEDAEAIHEIVRKEILRALREDPEVRRAVWLVAHSEFVDIVEMVRCFDPALAETPRNGEQIRPTSRPETGHRSP